MERIMSEELLENYKRYLEDEEKSPATIDKYIRDNRKIMKYAEGTLLTKPLLLALCARRRTFLTGESPESAR